MTSIAVDVWDEGRLLVNAEYAPLLRALRLTSCQTWLRMQGGEVAKHLIRERPTIRIVLETPDGPRAFYLKRLAPAGWRESFKRLLRGKSPVLTARTEWDALLAFHRLGIPTMTPVVYGQWRGHSFLVTAALENFTKFSEWLQHNPDESSISVPNTTGCACRTTQELMGESDRTEVVFDLLSSRPQRFGDQYQFEPSGDSGSTRGGLDEEPTGSTTTTLAVTPVVDRQHRREVLRQTAALARTIHQSGWHHQDFYAGHLLVPQTPGPLHVIDLGRAARLRYFRWVWIIKDLAQFYHSTPQLSPSEHLRCLRDYLGRTLRRADRWLIRAILLKASRIARHSRKHGFR